MSHFATAPHEIEGKVAWNDHGVSPYFAIGQLVDAVDGGASGLDIDVEGTDVETVSIGYYQCGVAPRPCDDLHRLHGYSIYWETQDGLKFGGKIEPIFEPEEYRVFDEDVDDFKQLDQISVPPTIGEATKWNIDAGKYREPDYYVETLPKVLSALAEELGVGWNDEYLRREPHPFTTLTDFERTGRITRDVAKKLARSDGILHRIFNLLSTQEGSEITYHADSTEIVPTRHTIPVDKDTAQKLFPNRPNVPGFELTVYQPKYVRSEEEKDDPLYHPRIGVLFRTTLNDGTGIAWSRRDEIADRLEEILINILSWGDVPIKPGPTFVADKYQEVRESDREIAFFDDPTPEIERENDHVLVEAFAKLSGEDVDRMRQLATDGGEAHYAELADETGDSVSTIYRFLQRTGELLESDDGTIRFISQRQRDRVLDVLKPLEDHVDASTRAIASLLRMDPKRFDEKGTAFQRWVNQYAVDVSERDDGQVKLRIKSVLDRLKFTSTPSLAEVLQEGLSAWQLAGLPGDDFRDATATFRHSTGGRECVRVREELG